MLALVREFARHDRTLAAVSLFCNLIAAIITIVLVREIAVAVFSPGTASIGRIAALTFLMFVAGTVGLLISKNMAVRSLSRMQSDYVASLKAMEFAELERRDPHQVLSVVTDDIQMVSSGFALLPNVFTSIALTVIGLGYIASLSPAIFACIMSVIIVATVGMGRLIGFTRANLRALRDISDKVYYFISASIFGAREIHQKPGVFDGWLMPRLARHLSGYIAMSDRNNALWAIIQNATIVFLIVNIAVAAVIGANIGLAYPDLTAIVLILMYLRPAIQMLVSNLPDLLASGVALQRLRQATVPSSSDPAGARPQVAPEGLSGVALQNVEYRYPGAEDDFRVGPLSFELSRGRSLFVYGGNGAGKSTLLGLLGGIYRPTAGAITAGGQKLTPQALRELVVCTHQKPNLFWPPLDRDGTPHASERVAQHLAHFGLPDLPHLNEERWLKGLSGGQVKRLAILHAWMDDRPFAAFDEPTADQDERFREFFFGQLIPDMQAQGRGVLVVTHDHQQARRADVVVTMTRGTSPTVELAQSEAEPV